MAAPLFVYAAQVRFMNYESGETVRCVVKIEVLARSEVYGLVASAILSRYPRGGDIDFLEVAGGPERSYDATRWERFEVGEVALVAHHVNNMIDPLPAYAAWQLMEIESIQEGGPVVWFNKEERVTFYTLVPYGIRKVWFNEQ